jgi:hypothetical protein
VGKFEVRSPYADRFVKRKSFSKCSDTKLPVLLEGEAQPPPLPAPRRRGTKPGKNEDGLKIADPVASNPGSSCRRGRFAPTRALER